MKRITALILVIVTLISLASCSKESASETAAIIAGDTKLSGDFFYTELLSYKNDFLVNYLGLTEDNADIWSQDSPSGRLETVGDTIRRIALEDMIQFAWVVEYAKDNGVSVTEEDKAEIAEAAQTLKDNFETEEEYREYLTAMKFTEESVLEYLELTFLYDKGFELLTGENGLYPVVEEDYDSYYEQYFYTTKHIFINNISKTDDEGNTVALTEEEIASQKAKADSIYADLESGISFDTLFMLSEDSMSSLYPDGITFTDGMIDSAYEAAAKALEVGEYTMADGDYGGIYIIYRMPLSEADREEYESFLVTQVNAAVADEIYARHQSEVTVNYDIINSYDIAQIPILA